MTPAARYAAAAEVLDLILGSSPAEQALTGWARRSRFAGSKDRAAVRDHVYDVLRARRSLAALGGAETGRGLMIGLMRREGGDAGVLFGAGPYGMEGLDAAEQAHLAAPLPEVPFDLPDWLLTQLRVDLGGEFQGYNNQLRGRAPVALRVNTARVSRQKAADMLLAEGVETQISSEVETALFVVSNPRRVQTSAAYLQGLVEVQDAGSQALVNALPFPEGGRVLDYCAGGGGKVLALAARGQAELTAHDANPRRMFDLPARAERAGVQVIQAEVPTGIFDLVLADVPCSGSGAWRRQPDAKWRLSASGLAELVAIQGKIINECKALTAIQGHFAYATCSVLRAENEDQIARHLTPEAGWQEVQSRRLPMGEFQDGFFLSVFRRLS